MSFFSFPVKQPNDRKSQPPLNFLKFASMSGPTEKIEKRYAILNYCARLLREWPTAIRRNVSLVYRKKVFLDGMTWKTLLTRCWNSPPTFFSIASSFTNISFTFFCKWSTFAWTINKENLNRIFKALQNTLSHNYPIYIPAFDVLKNFHFYWVRCIFINKMQNFVRLIACCPVSIIAFLGTDRENLKDDRRMSFPFNFQGCRQSTKKRNCSFEHIMQKRIINNYSLKSRWIMAKYLPSHEVAR